MRPPFEQDPDVWIIYGRAARAMFRGPESANRDEIARVMVQHPDVLSRAIQQLDALALELRLLSDQGEAAKRLEAEAEKKP